MNKPFCFVCQINLANQPREFVYDNLNMYSVTTCTSCGMQITFEALQPVNDHAPSTHRFNFLVEQYLKLIKLTRYYWINSKIAVQGKTLIDWGCGRGELVEFFRQKGTEAYGVEYNERTSSEARSRSIPVYLTKPIKPGYQPFELFESDVAIAYHFLEHVPNPRLQLQEIKKYLKKNGYI